MLETLDHDGTALVYAHLEARTLEEYVNALPYRVDASEARRWGEMLCDALAYLHEQQPPLVHLDLKPSSVLLTHDETTVLTGFGLTREISDPTTPCRLQIGAGTCGYAPPEQLDGLEVDVRADLYALGATLYAVLTRQTPPDSRDLRDGRSRLAPPETLHPGVPPELSNAISKLMSPNPALRPATATEARALLAAAATPAATNLQPTPSSATRAMVDVAPQTASVSDAPAPPKPIAVPSFHSAGSTTPRPGSYLASVLFIDIASYSTYRNDEQLQLRRVLSQTLKGLSCLNGIASNEVYIDLRAGDAAVMVFVNHLSAPLDAALELEHIVALPVADRLPLTLRMGLHVGAVSFDEAGEAVGEALNMGQRVTNAGCPGEITASHTYAEMLTSSTSRYDRLFGPMRLVDIKHGRQLAVHTVGDPPLSPPPTAPEPAPEPRMPPAVAPLSAQVTRPMQTVASPTTLPPSGVTLIITEGEQAGRRIALPALTVELGRGDTPMPTPSRLEIAERTLSRVQGTLQYDAATQTFTFVHNPAATNVTVVNNTIIAQHTLRHRDEIRVGQMAATVDVAIPLTPTPMRPPTAAAPPAVASACNVTGASQFDIAFIVRVTSGVEGDLGKSFPIAETVLARPQRLTLGGPGPRSNDIALADPAVSNRQAVLVSESAALRLAPEDTTRPTFVNGQVVTFPVALRHGDLLTVGCTQLRLEAATPQTVGSSWLDIDTRGVSRRLLLPLGLTRVGRLAPCEIIVDDPSVSRLHMTVETTTDGRSLVRHESATNPTLVNGVKLTVEKVLEDGDLIQISHITTLRYTKEGAR